MNIVYNSENLEETQVCSTVGAWFDHWVLWTVNVENLVTLKLFVHHKIERAG